jgi:hypothetical protein
MQKQILPLRGRMTTKNNSNCKADFSAAPRNDKQIKPVKVMGLTVRQAHEFICSLFGYK